jgi:hypothetical protein
VTSSPRQRLRAVRGLKEPEHHRESARPKSGYDARVSVDGISNKLRVQRSSAIDAITGPDPVAPVDKQLSADALEKAREAVGGETSSSSSSVVGTKAALHGLDLVKTKKKKSWRACVASALLGLSIIGGISPGKAHAPTLLNHQTPIGSMLDVQRARGPPPLTAQIGERHAEQPGPPPPPPPDVPFTIAREPQISLPDTLLQLPSGIRVTHGTDPGDFYCEHAFFTSTTEAFAKDTSIVRNQFGEVLTGFLHVPSDEFTYDASKTPVQSERHRERRDVVGAAIRGYWEQARAQIGDGPFRMLLTGYGTWDGVVNNPSGDFTKHKENIDAAMLRAFGDSLVSTSGKILRESESGDSVVRRISYNIRNPITGAPNKVIIEAVRLPVTDDAINGSPHSLQARIGDFRPHAVMSMGVSGSGDYKAEFHADDGGLALKDGTQAHDGARTFTRAHPDNRSLARAIHLGSKAPVTTTSGAPRV